jgi:hypothetical protein
LINLNQLLLQISYILDEEQQKAFDIMENTNKIYLFQVKQVQVKFSFGGFCKSINKKVLKLATYWGSCFKYRGATIHSAFGYFNIGI